ncbi:MAG TPA: hypothetical protein VIB60_00905 [Methylomirabilota bacterium]
MAAARDAVLQKVLIVLAWGVLVAWAVRPVPGKGIPLGRRRTRIHLSGRQAVMLGSVLLAASIGAAWAFRSGDRDVQLVALCAAWLGALLVFHGRRI